jgi:hypothetical protein
VARFIQEFLPKGHISRPGRPLNNPTSFTIHWIGAFPNQTPTIVRNWWLRGSDGNGVAASTHYIIKDDVCMQVVPEGEITWHCGGPGNFNSISVEVIPMNVAGEFSQSSIDTLKELYNRIPLRARDTILRDFDHRPPRDCPRWYTPVVPGGEERWQELCKELRDGS